MKRLSILAFAVILAASCNFNIPVEEIVSALAEDSPEGLLELPAVNSGDVVITHSGYALCYNPSTKIPNWVAYELTAKEASGTLERGERSFSMDPKYKKTQAMREDYSNSGWSRGHMAPAADFRWDSDAMDETFYLTNICPQNSTLNGKDWNYLEGRVRSWAGKYGRVWVVTGPIVGTNKYGTIGEHNVVVPDSFYKVVLASKDGAYKAIGFVMDNDAKRYYLDKCAMTVNEVEKLTGLDFFPNLDDKIEEQVESQKKFSDWGIKTK
ncbi:MAG: DNA/RNA non-specific endonuclease [Bacteroidales bacterium]|nr:DNA/RNA non-specific endonuclease [Bacteroidales bacterium]